MKEFKTMTGEEIMNTPLPQTNFVVSELLPTGVHILGGAPKIGKSWLMLWMCLQISKGEKVWDYDTRKGTVLYLCLEDSYSRIQNRLFEITDDAPENLHFSVMAENVENGLSEQIEAFVSRYENTNLIVIDTLQNICMVSDGSNNYADDYRELKILREISNKHNITILLVHHLRKSKDDDPMNMLSGTTGISGAVDTVFILSRKKRTEKLATLFCSGRDIEFKESSLEMDSNFIWQKIDDQQAEVKFKEVDEFVKCIIHYFCYTVSNAEFIGTATDLSNLFEMQYDKYFASTTIKKKLLKNHNFFFEQSITIDFKRTHTDKIIHIKGSATIIDVDFAFGASVEQDITGGLISPYDWTYNLQLLPPVCPCVGFSERGRVVILSASCADCHRRF